MTACEPCWNEAFRQSRLIGGSQVDHYLKLLELLDSHPHDGPPRPATNQPPAPPASGADAIQESK